jgi:hypothetical protein
MSRAEITDILTEGFDASHDLEFRLRFIALCDQASVENWTSQVLYDALISEFVD